MPSNAPFFSCTVFSVHRALKAPEPQFENHLLACFIAKEADKCCCQSGGGDPPPLQLGAHRSFASGFYASLGPRLQDCPPPPQQPRTLGCGLFHGGDLSSSPPSLSQLLQICQTSSLFSSSMAVRGVIRVQQRNS